MANNFSSDSNCKALWKLDSGALTTDSISTNTLTNTGVAEDTTNQREGTGCGDWESTGSDRMTITDASLATGFPLKTGDTNKKISVCFWLRLESISANGNTFWTKYNATTQRSFWTGCTTGGAVSLSLGYNAGASFETHNHATALSLATWYHATFTYDDSDKSYAIRIRDTSGNVVGTDLTGIATLDANKLSVTAAPVVIGATFNGGTPAAGFYHDGLHDEIVVFDDIITSSEATQISLGTYGSGVGNPYYAYAQQ